MESVFGFEVQLFATPNMGSLLDKVAGGQLCPNLLGFVGAALRFESPEDFANNGGPYDPERAWLAVWARNCTASVDLDRRFDWLAWALHRVHPGAEKAVEGTRVLACPRDGQGFARSTQGFPFKFNGRVRCAELAAILNELCPKDLEAQVRAGEMDPVYQSYSYEPAYMVRDFRDVQKLYTHAARSRSAILVTKD